MCHIENKINKMKCSDVKIWLNKVSEDQLFTPPSEIQEHIAGCKICSTDFNIIKKSINLMSYQKNLNFSDSGTQNLIRRLSELSYTENQLKKVSYSLTRIAAAIIIAIGLFAGALAGNIISKKNNESGDLWRNEFSQLSDNNDYSSMLFD